MEPEYAQPSVVGYYQKFASIADRGQSVFLLLIRLYIGYQSMVAGWGHLHHVDDTANFFSSLHIPFPRLNVYMSATTELVGGILLLLGVASRLTSLALVGNFFVAIFTVALKQNNFSVPKLLGAIWNDQNIILNDTAFPFFVTALIVLLFGPGWFSIDGWIRCSRECRTPVAEIDR